MSLEVARACRIGLSAAALLVAVTACDEAQLPGGSATTGPVNPSTSRSLPVPSAPAADPSGSGTGSASGAGSDGRVSALFELNGSGKSPSVVIDDGSPGGFTLYDAPLPFRKELRVDPNVDLLQIHGGGAPPLSCRITINGTVVVESPNTGDCVYNNNHGK